VCLEILDHGNDQLAELGRKRGPISQSLSTRLSLVHGLVTPAFWMRFWLAELEAAFWSLLMGKTNGPELRVTRKQLIESRDYSKNSQ